MLRVSAEVPLPRPRPKLIICRVVKASNKPSLSFRWRAIAIADLAVSPASSNWLLAKYTRMKIHIALGTLLTITCGRTTDNASSSKGPDERKGVPKKTLLPHNRAQRARDVLGELCCPLAICSGPLKRSHCFRKLAITTFCMTQNESELYRQSSAFPTSSHRATDCSRPASRMSDSFKICISFHRTSCSGEPVWHSAFGQLKDNGEMLSDELRLRCGISGKRLSRNSAIVL